MATSTIQISQLTLATTPPVAADSVAGANAAGAARRYTVGSLGTAHTHDASSISAGMLDLARVPTHTHSIAQVSGLQTSLDGKAALAATNVLRVETLNGLNGAVTIEAGTGVAVATQGSKVTVSATGGTSGGAVSSVNSQTGTVVLTSVSVSAASAVHTHTTAQVTGLDSHIATQATNANVVRSLNGITGAVVITHTSVSAAAASHTHDDFDISVDRSFVNFGGNAPLHEVLDEIDSAIGLRALASATNVTRVVSLQGLTGTVTLVGVNLTVETAAGAITLTAPAAGVGGGGGIVSVNGITATAITLTSASVSAASAVHSHVAADITDFATEAAKHGPVESVNSAVGPITIAAGSNITVDTKANEATSGSTITISADGGGGIVSVNGQTATAVTLTNIDVSAAPELPVVTAVSITGSVNNYSLPTGDIFRLSHTATTTINITGFATAVDGASRLLINVSTGASSSYTIKHQDTNSTAVSRVIVPWAGDYVVSPNGGAALIIYDDTDDRWRVV